MSSDTEIANFALSHLGIGQNISSLTEKSEEARACNQFYALARDTALRNFRMPFARKVASLGLVSTNSAFPQNEFQYTYRYPSDCLELRRVASGSRFDSAQTKVAYRISSDDNGKLVLTDASPCYMEYTYKVTNTALYPADFVLGLSYLLASLIANRVTTGDNFQKGKQMLALYDLTMKQAQANALMEEVPDRLADAEWIRNREGYDSESPLLTGIFHTVGDAEA